jgi:hypothetical protein
MQVCHHTIRIAQRPAHPLEFRDYAETLFQRLSVVLTPIDCMCDMGKLGVMSQAEYIHLQKTCTCARETLETSRMTSRAHFIFISNAALAVARFAQKIANTPLTLARTCKELLLIRRSNDVFARVRLGQHTGRVWEPFHETPVEKSGGDEGVDVTDGEAL